MLDSCLLAHCGIRDERERERVWRVLYARTFKGKRSSKKEDRGYDLTVVRQSCRAVHVTIKISPASRKPLRESTYGRDPAEVVNLLLLLAYMQTCLPFPPFSRANYFSPAGLRSFLGTTRSSTRSSVHTAHVLRATERLFTRKGNVWQDLMEARYEVCL